MKNDSKGHVLITGGTGFIGSHLAARLVDRYQVTLLDLHGLDVSTAHDLGLDENPAVTVICGDISEEACLERLPTDVTHLVHAAGVLGVGYVNVNPLKTMGVNGIGTWHILNWAKKLRNLKRVVVFSTSEVGGSKEGPQKEDDLASIEVEGMRGCYASSKLFAEFLGRGFFQEHNMPVVSVRPFNVYGPYRKGNNAMTNLISKALQGAPMMITGNGQQKRCWCHVDDFINGIELLLSEKAVNGRIYNIGNPADCLTLKELAHLIKATLKSSSPVVLSGQVIQDIQTRIPDIRAAQNDLNFHPKVGLTQGILDVANALQDLFIYKEVV